MNLAAFVHPWEHVRLLSDRARNDAMVALLARRAPGARVVEVGCGSGLLACVAARLGAASVVAIEPTELWRDAQALVDANGLGGVVEVVHGRVEDVPPRPADLVFSELLNADVFAEGVLSAMDAARAWVVPGGHLAPRRIRVWAALARAWGSAREVRSALREVHRLAGTHGLEAGPLVRAITPSTPYRYVSSSEEAAAGGGVLVCEVLLGRGERPLDLELELPAVEAGPVGGALVWFEAELDEGILLSNAPHGDDHWGRLVCAWPEERGARAGERVPVAVRFGPAGISILPR